MPYSDPERRRQYFRDYDKARKDQKRLYRMARRDEKIAYSRNYDATHKEARAVYMHKTKERRTKTVRSYHIRSKYGMTEAELDALFESQDYKCAICSLDLRDVKGARGLHMDHCHTTGATRAGLCPQCNRGIGLFRESTDALRTAADYLDLWNKKTGKVA